ncbi:hypothetical protein MMC19_002651 [Ptychographa xylographoides]|nr:hypothetical protein [Ptychographa xylographoides]
MGIDPPFLYDHPSRYSFTGPTEKGFNPKAASESSWTPRAPKLKPDGPLINAKELNRHPDSYFIVPYGQLDWKPLNSGTKSRVAWTRWIQLVLRVCALLGAAGLLVCVICIKGVDNTTGWIIRIAPGIAILHTVYAIYHLVRLSKGRTPASSASYMLFAAILDAGLIPFLVFTALMSQVQYRESSDTTGRWQTLFGDDPDTYKIIYSTFLISVTTGGIHLVSLCISVYLAVIFRKISRLPPDMNPLESNLTSRHKRNKSSLSTAPSEVTNSRDAHLSAPLIDGPRVVPFMHTRTDSSESLSPHRRQPNSDRNFRPDLSQYQQTVSQRSSRSDLPRSTRTTPRPTSTYANSRPNSARPASTRPQSTVAPLDNNWFTYPSSTPSPPNTGPRELQHLRINHKSPSPAPPRVNKYDFENMTPRPLEMNPPTPPISSYRHQKDGALVPTSGNVVWHGDQQKRPRHGRGDSFGVVRDKSRYYGELHAGKGRVVSSGAKVEDRRGMRTREVSGKVAEEGRGSMRY